MNYNLGLCSISFRKHTPEEILRAMKEVGLSVIEWGSDVHCLPLLKLWREGFSTWAANTIPVAEFTVAQIILANNEQTKGVLNGKFFEKMQPYATFINTGRGAQVVEQELIDILKLRPDLKNEPCKCKVTLDMLKTMA